MKIEITVEGPFDIIFRLRETLKDFSPEFASSVKHRGSLRIVQNEKEMEGCLLVVSRALRGIEDLEFRVRNLSYSEPVVRFSDRPYRPIPSLLIQPWHPSLPEAGNANAIIMDQQHAFGSGMHPTTILCLEGLEEISRSPSSLKNKEILDFGCGTGLLAIAAAKWGAQRVLGVDVDAASVLTARRNVGLNRIDEKVTIAEGSWGAVTGTFDAIIANLVPSVLYRTGKEIHSHLKPDGSTLVSGFSERQMGDMEAFLLSTGLYSQDRKILKGWAALTLTCRKGKNGRISGFE